jgi:NTP pyrophosphatase (non-canonical NTP hydrolase)
MSINILAREIHENAVEHGWWDCNDSLMNNIPEKLALIHSEISEALEEYRDNRNLSDVYYKEGSKKPEGFPVELADAMIRIMDLAEYLHIDMRKTIETKMDYNKTRLTKHGGKKC